MNFILLLRREACPQKTSLTALCFIEVLVPRQVIGDVFVLRVSILPLSTILIFYFGIVPTVWYFLSISYFITHPRFVLKSQTGHEFMSAFTVLWSEPNDCNH